MSRRLSSATLPALLALVALWVPTASLSAQPDKPAVKAGENNKDNTQGREQEPQDKAQKEIEAWTQKLHGPSIEGREDAVVNLISMNDARAHDPLIVALDRATEGNATHLPLAKVILGQLRRSLANQRHPVFGVGDARDSMRRAYMRPVVKFYLPLEDGKTHPLQNAAGDCLRKLPTSERLEGAKLLLGTDNRKLRAATLLALGDSWDLNMAPFLAGYLEDPALVVAAIRGLKRLTFKDLRTKEEYAAWWEVHKGSQYMEVAVEAARDADRSISRERQQNAEEIRRLYAQLVEFLVTSKRPDRWKEIQGRIFDERPGVMQACLEMLRDRLRNGIDLAGGTEASDRLNLLASLHKELRKAGLPPPRYSLLLEVTSHLIAPAEARERAEQEKLLREALSHASVEVALAGLRGLRQFPSPDNRLAVVLLTRRVRARQTQAPTKDERQILAEALATLKSAGWTAPLPTDKDHAQWQEILAALLLDNDLDGVLRGEVVKALAKADSQNGHPEGVQRELSTLAGRPTEELTLRQAALLELPQVLTDAQSADDYVKFLINLLQDKEEEVRKEAAIQLKSLPYEKDRTNEKRVVWQKLLLENLTIDQLLGSENSDKVFAVLVDRLVKLTKENQQHSSAVFERLSRAVEAVHKENKPETAFKVPVLKQGLISYAIAKDRLAVEWVRACEALIAVQDRKSTLAILEARAVKLDTEKEEIRALYQKMRVKLALLAGDPGNGGVGNGSSGSGNHDGTALPWSAKSLRAEAIEVIAALQALEKMEPVPPEVNEPEVRLLWLCCLAGTGQYDNLVKRATAWLGGADTLLQGSDRVNATLLLALAYLEIPKPQPDLAVQWIRKLASGNAGGSASTLPDDKAGLALVERIAALLVESARKTGDDDTITTAQMMARHVARSTDSKDHASARRRLLDLEAQSVGADSATKSGLRGQLDRLFGVEGGQVPEELEARVEKLRKELGG